MVCLAERERLVVKSSMAVAPERTAAKPLHNFDLPCLKWGNQRYLRCVKVNSDGGRGNDRRSVCSRFESSPADRRREPESERRKRQQRFFSKPGKEDEKDDGEEEIAAVREKLMCDLKKAADKMKYAIFRKEEEVAAAEGDDEVEEEDDTAVEDDEEDDGVAASAAYGEKLPPAAAPSAAAAAGVETRPWNLRTRRAACKAPAKGLRIEDRKDVNWSPLRTEGNNGARSPRLVRGLPPEKKERVKFSVPLARKEIEEDFMALLGHRPPRRPKKRPRIVQRYLDVSRSRTRFSRPELRAVFRRVRYLFRRNFPLFSR